MEEEKEKNSAERVKFTGAEECRRMELAETGTSPQMSLRQHLEKYFGGNILVTCSVFFSAAVFLYSQIVAQVP